MKEPKGALRQAMKKYVMSEYKLASISVVHFNGALKKLTEAGTLEQSENGQRWKIKKVTVPKPAAKKPAAKKPTAKKATTAKKPAAKKPAKKVVKKTATKKPAKKAVKKPAAKKAKK